MLKRLYLVLCCLWAVALIGNGLTREGGVQSWDIQFAAAPFVAGWLLVRIARFIAWGSP